MGRSEVEQALGGSNRDEVEFFFFSLIFFISARRIAGGLVETRKPIGIVGRWIMLFREVKTEVHNDCRAAPAISHVKVSILDTPIPAWAQVIWPWKLGQPRF